MTQTQKILPQDPAASVRQIIKMVEQLIEVMEQESRALTMRDGVSFTALQDQKDDLAARYEMASAEFKSRLPEFRRTDRALLNRLEILQRDLAARTQENMDMMGRMAG